MCMRPWLQVLFCCLQVVTRISLTIQSKVLRGRWTLVEAEMAARSCTWRHVTVSKQWCVNIVTVHFYKCTQSQTNSWYRKHYICVFLSDGNHSVAAEEQLLRQRCHNEDERRPSSYSVCWRHSGRLHRWRASTCLPERIRICRIGALSHRHDFLPNW